MKRSVRFIRLLLAVIGLFAVFTTLQAGVPGDFDTSFSVDGFDAVATGELSHEGHTIAVQDDGKIVVGGDPLRLRLYTTWVTFGGRPTQYPPLALHNRS